MVPPLFFLQLLACVVCLLAGSVMESIDALRKTSEWVSTSVASESNRAAIKTVVDGATQQVGRLGFGPGVGVGGVEELS